MLILTHTKLKKKKNLHLSYHIFFSSFQEINDSSISSITVRVLLQLTVENMTVINGNLFLRF